jgi:hypothetical protein
MNQVTKAADQITRTTASVTYKKADGTTETFREFVAVFHDDVNLQKNGVAVENLAKEEDAEDSGQKGFNYRTEPTWTRNGGTAGEPLEISRTRDFSKVWSNDAVGGDPETPVFEAAAGTPVRFRVVQPGGHQRNHVFQVHGHGFQDSPWIENSTKLGDQALSEWKGSVMGIGPSSHENLLLTNGAGGAFKVPGDYMFRDMQSFAFDGGLWGIMRVLPAAKALTGATAGATK